MVVKKGLAAKTIEKVQFAIQKWIDVVESSGDGRFWKITDDLDIKYII